MKTLLTENINRIWSSLIIDEIIKNEITHFYLSPGMRNAPLIAALDHLKKFHSDIQTIICMDERSGAYRALGYSKATGKPSVLICTSGTALANYTPAVIEAKKSNLPLIVISADRPSEMIFCDDNQTIDQSKFFGNFIQGEMNLGAPTTEISPLALTTSLSNLIHKSNYPQKGPVHLNCQFREPLEATVCSIPEDYIRLAQEQVNRSRPSTRYINSSQIPNHQDIAEIAHELLNSQSGLLIIGSLNPYDETEDVLRFVRELNWPTFFDVSSSLKYQMNLSDNTIPTFDHPEVQEALIKNPPQTIFHIGGRLTSKHYYSILKKIPSINLITISRNIEKEDPSHHTKLRINADINQTLKQIMLNFSQSPLERKTINLNFESFTKQKINLINESPLSYPVVSKAVIENIKNGSTLYIGNSTVVRSFDAYFSHHVKKQLKVATNRGVSGIEGFIASANGFIDGSHEEVFLILGDVSFIHDLNSLYFLSNQKIPLKIIIINNGGGGIFTLLPINNDKNVIEYITSPHQHSFSKAAELVNIDYYPVYQKSELPAQFAKISSSTKHSIMEIFVDNETNKSVYDKLKTIKL